MPWISFLKFRFWALCNLLLFRDCSDGVNLPHEDASWCNFIDYGRLILVHWSILVFVSLYIEIKIYSSKPDK